MRDRVSVRVAEVILPITDKHSDYIEIGDTGWISIHINDEESRNEPLPAEAGNPWGEEAGQPKSFHLFEHAGLTVIPLPERFPRLAFAAIALAILLSALTAEFDYLRGGGYYWP